MTPGWVENLSDGPKIVHGPIFYINLEFETCGAGIWEKKINLGPSNIYTLQFSTIDYNTVLYSRLYGTIHSTVQDNTVLFSTIQYRTVL